MPEESLTRQQNPFTVADLFILADNRIIISPWSAHRALTTAS